MKAQAYEVVRNITVDQGRREGRLDEIKAEIAASQIQVGDAQTAIRYALADRKAAVKRLDRARKELAAFVEVNLDCIGVAR